MSQILSGLILIELQKFNPNPVVATQQKQLADAIGSAVSTYLSTPGNVVLRTPAVGLTPVPIITAGPGVIAPPILIKAN